MDEKGKANSVRRKSSEKSASRAGMNSSIAGMKIKIDKASGE